MTTEPTVSQALAAGDAYVLLDTRTAAGSAAALGGAYPATSLYLSTDYVDTHRDIVQKLVNAYVATLQWIHTHNGNEIADKMPPQFYAGSGKDAYAQALDSEKGIFNPTGLMPPLHRSIRPDCNQIGLILAGRNRRLSTARATRLAAEHEKSAKLDLSESLSEYKYAFGICLVEATAVSDTSMPTYAGYFASASWVSSPHPISMTLAMWLTATN